jgi:hypothetical protein
MDEVDATERLLEHLSNAPFLSRTTLRAMGIDLAVLDRAVERGLIIERQSRFWGRTYRLPSEAS